MTGAEGEKFHIPDDLLQEHGAPAPMQKTAVSIRKTAVSISNGSTGSHLG
jgi:hypothetical protein